jgi:transposase-like protein
MTASTTLPKRRQICRSPSQWRELFARFEQSGQTRAQFCADHGLGVSTFDRWRRRLHQDGLVARVTSDEALFVEVAQDAPARSTPPWDVELQLGSGVVLRLRHTQC